jgi:hypothetical protein
MISYGPRFLTKWMLLIILIGVVIRLVLGFLLTYNYDVYHWALTISNFEAGNGLYDTAGYYYTPVWGYFLGVFTQFTELFGLDSLGDRFAELLFTEDDVCITPHTAFVTSLGFNIGITVLITIFDILTAFMVHWVVREVFKDDRKAMICAAIWMLCPLVIVVGAIGGMFDVMSAFLLLLCVALLMKEQELLAGMILSTAVMLKFFPGFLVFLLIAYIIVKHRDDWKPRMAKAVLGAGVMLAIIMVPQVMDGTIMDSLSFMTARASSEGEGMSLDSIMMMLSYVAILVGEVILALFYVKVKHDDDDRAFIGYLLFGSLIIFIFPSAPQYLLMLAPFLVIHACCSDRRIWVPLILLMVFTSLFDLSSLPMEMTSVLMYTDWLPMDAWMPIYDAFASKVFGITTFDAIDELCFIMQSVAVIIAIAMIAYRVLLEGTEEGRFIRERLPRSPKGA